MADQKLTFHSGSRKPFPEEEPVLEVVRRAKEDVAQQRSGRVIAGQALFKSVSTISFDATVHPRAVDIVNAAVGNAPAGGRVGRVNAIVNNKVVQRQSKISEAQGEIAASLRRLGIHR